MGTADSLSKEFLSDSDVFAEVCNLLYHHGRPVVRPDSLRELSPSESLLLSPDHVLGRERDLLKGCAGKASPDGSIEVLLVSCNRYNFADVREKQSRCGLKENERAFARDFS